MRWFYHEFVVLRALQITSNSLCYSHMRFCSFCKKESSVLADIPLTGLGFTVRYSRRFSVLLRCRVRRHSWESFHHREADWYHWYVYQPSTWYSVREEQLINRCCLPEARWPFLCPYYVYALNLGWPTRVLPHEVFSISLFNTCTFWDAEQIWINRTRSTWLSRYFL